jgi:hypothetical protein
MTTKKKNNKQAFNNALTKRGRTTVIPGELWVWPISVMAKAVYGLILDQADEYTLSVPKIQKRLGVKSNHTIINAIAELESHNLLKIEREQGRSNCYHFIDPQEWLEVPKPADQKTENAPEPEESFRETLQQEYLPGWLKLVAHKQGTPGFKYLHYLLWVMRENGICMDTIVVDDLIDLCCSDYEKTFEDMQRKISSLIEKIYLEVTVENVQ